VILEMQDMRNENLQLAEKVDQKLTELDQRIKILKKLPTPPTPESVITDITIPLFKEFSDFYGDYTMYKTQLLCEVSDQNIITIRNKTPNARTLQIGLYSIVELLADKYNQPISQFYNHGAAVSPLPDFDNIHTQLQETVYWVEANFSRILEYSDDRVIKICKDYYNTKSLPLILRLRFYEFEKALISVKINGAIQEGLKERDEKVRQFEKEYAKKLETAKLNFRTRMDEARKLAERYKWIAQDLQSDLETAQSKLEAVKNETSTTSQKLIDSESKVEDLEKKYSDTKLKCERLERDLKRFTEQPWVMGSTSTIDAPTFMNVVSGETIIYPPVDEFKKDWKPNGKEGDSYIYKKGSNTIKIPESLEYKFNDLIKELYKNTAADDQPSNSKDTKTKKVVIKNKISENDDKVLDAITKNKDGLTQTEAAVAAKISPKHISKHINKLEDFDLIFSREVEIEGRKVTKYFAKN